MLRRCLTSWCRMSTWKRTWTLSLTELTPHRDWAGTGVAEGSKGTSSRDHTSPGSIAGMTLTLTGFLVQRRKTFKELTEHVAWGREVWGGVGPWGRVRGGGSPLQLLLPDVAPETTPLSWLCLPHFSFCSKLVADPDRIETLCLKPTSRHRTVSI